VSREEEEEERRRSSITCMPIYAYLAGQHPLLREHPDVSMGVMRMSGFGFLWDIILKCYEIEFFK